MGKPINTSSKVVKEYILKFPNTANLTLAKKIYSENKVLFNDVEHVRTIVRMYKGNMGNYNRENLGVEFRKQLNKLKKEMPKGESEKIEPYHLPKSQRKVLIINDIHIPFQSDETLFAALQYGADKGVDTIWLNGDIMDCYQVSRHEKDPRQRSLKYEIDATKIFLRGIRNMFPKALIIYKLGNHELRLSKYIMQQAPALLDIEAITLPELLEFNELNIHLLHDKQVGHIGELKILHGHETLAKSGGVNPARALYLKTGESVCVAHFHRRSEHSERTLTGKVIKTYSIGCACDLYPSYMPYNNWSNGFAYVEVDKNGSYRFFNHTVIDGVVY